jgi:hypothetical protein
MSVFYGAYTKGPCGAVNLHALHRMYPSFSCSCSSDYYSLLCPSLLFCLPMVHIKHAMRPIGDEAPLAAIHATSHEVA